MTNTISASLYFNQSEHYGDAVLCTAAQLNELDADMGGNWGADPNVHLFDEAFIMEFARRNRVTISKSIAARVYSDVLDQFAAGDAFAFSAKKLDELVSNAEVQIQQEALALYAHLPMEELLRELGYKADEVSMDTYVYIDVAGHLSGMEKSSRDGQPDDEYYGFGYAHKFGGLEYVRSSLKG